MLCLLSPLGNISSFNTGAQPRPFTIPSNLRTLPGIESARRNEGENIYLIASRFPLNGNPYHSLSMSINQTPSSSQTSLHTRMASAPFPPCSGNPPCILTLLTILPTLPAPSVRHSSALQSWLTPHLLRNVSLHRSLIWMPPERLCQSLTHTD